MVALIGVVIGALLAGSMQAALARLQARRMARIAGKLMLMAMLELGASLQGSGTPGQQLNHARRALDAWGANHRDLAGALSTGNFLALAIFFTALKTATTSEERLEERKLEFSAELEQPFAILKFAAMGHLERRRNDKSFATRESEETLGT